jgi:cytochrome c551/c552
MVEASDPENDKLRYIWRLGKGIKRETAGPKLIYTFTTSGDYTISVEVRDDKSRPAISNKVNVYAGNEAPTVKIILKGNKTFYFPGTPVVYKVAIEDRDDTAKRKDLNDLYVSADYIEGSDKAAIPQGHQTLNAAAVGKNLMLSLDCKTCHKTAEKSIGPAFQDVAIRYRKDPNMTDYLTQKIIKGGSGKWGEVAMPAHPSLKEEDIRQIIGWIQTLGGGNKVVKSLPAAGSVNATLNRPEKEKGILTISASYTDKGGKGIQPLTGSYSLSLRNSKLSFDLKTGKQAIIGTDSVDLSTIKEAVLQVNWAKGPVRAGTFELRLDGPDGAKIGTFSFEGDARDALLKSTLEPVKDGKLHKLFIIRPGEKVDDGQLVVSFLQFNNK